MLQNKLRLLLETFSQGRSKTNNHIIGLRRQYLSDIYHYLIGISWAQFILIILFLFFIFIAAFAHIYLLGGNCLENARPNSFADYFFFSLQTFTTIGYGNIFPKNDYARIIVFGEAFIGLMFMAMTTGLVFSKFSVPTSRVIFSRNALMSKRNQKPVLTFRVANERGNQIVEAQLSVTLLTTEDSSEYGRCMMKLDLIRKHSPIFALTWSIFHEIDEQSPLFGKNSQNLEKDNTQIIISLVGIDNISGQTIHARHIYNWSDIIWNARFEDILSKTENNIHYIDYRKFHNYSILTNDCYN